MLRASAALVALGCAARLLFLDSDPYYYRWLGFLSDEGRWVEHARRAALGGPFFESAAHNEHFLLSPAYSALSALAFWLGGVQVDVARAVPALSGCLLLVLLALFLRTRVPPTGVFLALSTVALQADWVQLSRVAIPEMPMALGALAVFCVLAGAERPRPLLAGALSTAILALKGTGFPLLAAFCAVAFAAPPGPVSLRDPLRWRQAARFALGAGGIAALALVGLLAAAPERLSGVAKDFLHIADFLRFPSPQTLATIPLYSNLSPVLNTTALGLWTCALCSWALRDEPLDEPAAAARLRRAAWIWLAIYPIQMLTMKYLPGRYQAHLLVPAAIVFGACVAPLLQFRASALTAALAALPARRARWMRALFVFPSAVWLLPLVIVLAYAVGVPLDRVRMRAPYFLIAVAGTAWASGWLALDPARVRALIVFPWVCTVSWFACFLVLPGRVPFWPASADGAAALLAVVATGALCSLPLASLRIAAWGRRAPVAVGALCVVGWALHLAPGFLWPRYQHRELADRLGEDLAQTELILTASQGLFLGTNLAIRDPLDDPIDDTAADEAVIVTVGGVPDKMEDWYAFSSRYRLIRLEPIRRPEPFVRTCKPGFGCDEPFDLRVYRRRDGVAAPPGLRAR